MARHTANGNNASGFTLIELMIAISVFSILITIAQPIYYSAIKKAKEATLKRDLFVMRDVIDRYYSDQGEYPATLADLVEKDISGASRSIPLRSRTLPG